LATAFPDKDEISRTNRILLRTADVGISLDVEAHPISKALDPEFAARRQLHRAIIPLVKAETG
jgi:hypothetical protein